MSISAVTNAVEELVYQNSTDLVSHFKEFFLEKTNMSSEDLTVLLDEFVDKNIKKVAKPSKKKVAVKSTATSTAASTSKEDKPKRPTSAYNIFLGKMMKMKMTMVEAQVKWSEWKTENPELSSQGLLDKWVSENEPETEKASDVETEKASDAETEKASDAETEKVSKVKASDTKAAKTSKTSGVANDEDDDDDDEVEEEDEDDEDDEDEDESPPPPKALQAKTTNSSKKK
jgi:hypothetical protein